jgi:hypothetical protein
MKLGMNMLLWFSDVSGSEYDETFAMLKDAGSKASRSRSSTGEVDKYAKLGKRLGKRLGNLGLERPAVAARGPDESPISDDPVVRAKAAAATRANLDSAAALEPRLGGGARRAADLLLDRPSRRQLRAHEPGIDDESRPDQDNHDEEVLRHHHASEPMGNRPGHDHASHDDHHEEESDPKYTDLGGRYSYHTSRSQFIMSQSLPQLRQEQKGQTPGPLSKDGGFVPATYGGTKRGTLEPPCKL